jgi:hypothetical protein
MGENRRQPDAHGSGRNIEQVAIRPDGQFGFARTFRYAPAERQYQNSRLLVLQPGGEAGEPIPCDWKTKPFFADDGAIVIGRADATGLGRIDPETGALSSVEKPGEVRVDAGEYHLVHRGAGRGSRTLLYRGEDELTEIPLPPYPLHKLLTSQGSVVIATTQGLVQTVDREGKTVWTQRRLERIDAALLLEEQNLLAIAYKQYADRSSWVATPVLELLSLEDGTRMKIYEGEPADDFGHYGTDLVLSAAFEARLLFLGDFAGRLYAQPF